MIRFGVAGNSKSFYDEGNERTLQAAAWCKARGIDAFEYSFGRGININSATAEKIGAEFSLHGVALSVHAPYFINFSNTNEDMILKSIGYVVNSIEKVLIFGGNRVVFHPASQGKLTRDEAVSVCKSNIEKLSDVLNSNPKYEDIIICAETMGKIGQIGTVDEIIEFCKVDRRIYPCVDFGHINAREQGILKSARDYEEIIVKLLDNLPSEKVKYMHIHFSKIEYGKGGEVRHLTFEDKKYGPDFEPLAEILHKYTLSPVIICESDGTQAEDAVEMKRIYNSFYSK